MDTTALTKQMIGFQKTMLDNSYNFMVTTQDQTEKMLSSYLENMPWATDEGKKSLQDSIEMGKKARADFKKAMDDGFSKFEEIVTEQAAKSAPLKKAA